MSVVQARIQTVEEIYEWVWSAVADKRPIEAGYEERRRLFCPHRLGRNRGGELRVLCYQYGGESDSGLGPAGSPSNWRCIALKKLSRVKLLSDRWRTAPNHSPPLLLHCTGRYRRGGLLPRARSTEGTLRQIPEQQSGKDRSQRRDRIGIMPLGASVASRAVGSPAPFCS
jgi:hypothetical protein